MSTIITTRTYQQGDNFEFTVAAKNGYGINVGAIPSMQQYLEPNSEYIEPIGDVFDGHYNDGYVDPDVVLYPGVRIGGTIVDTSVNYSIGTNVCRELTYGIKFDGGYNPTTHEGVLIITPQNIESFHWSDNPLILETPTSDETSGLVFVSWHCTNDGLDYIAGSQVYVNDDLEFTAQWQPAPVSVGVESDTESSTIPEFENE